MFVVLTLALATVAATVLLHAAGTTWWLRRLQAHGRRKQTGNTVRTFMAVLVKTALVLITLHVLEIAIWALYLRFLPGSGLSSFSESLYLSSATFTTLGYGDVTLAGPWRVMAGFEALTGIILLGWSTALSFAVIRGGWESLEHEREQER